MRALLRVSCLALAVSAYTCDGKGPVFFLPGLTSPQTGDLSGLVASGNSPFSGATVALSGTPAHTTTTGTNGMYNFLDLDLGQYTITTTAPGFVCPSAIVDIQLDLMTIANIACTPAPGTVTGTVRLNSGPFAGQVVTLSGMSNNTVRTVTTDANGNFTFADVPPGTYNVEIKTPPQNVLCEGSTFTVTSGQVSTVNLDCGVLTPSGTLSVVTRLDGSPSGGMGFTVTRNGTVVYTSTTGTAGTAEVLLEEGTYSVSVTPPAGATCGPAQTVTIVGSQTSTATFDCASPPGSVNGVVRTDGNPEHSVTVTLSQGSTTIATTTTDLFGGYSFAGVPAGNYTVTITPTSSQSCPTTSQSVTVVSGQPATRNFDCTAAPSQFSVTLATSYRHIAVGSSETCVKITTSPPQPGATWSVTWTGPGNVGTHTRTGTLDANGEAFYRLAIHQVGTYTATVSVTSNGVTVNASSSVPVTSAPGTCPAPAP
jgi:hypothetical protein